MPPKGKNKQIKNSHLSSSQRNPVSPEVDSSSKKRKTGKTKEAADDDAEELREYMAGGAKGKPPPNLLAQFEKSPDAAMMMSAESTGFGENDVDLLLDQFTSPDEDVRERAIEALTKVCASIGPSEAEQNAIRDSFYRCGGDHFLQLQNCSVCGVTDFRHTLLGRIWPLDLDTLESVLLLNAAELEV
jgi:hypothetical protein